MQPNKTLVFAVDEKHYPVDQLPEQVKARVAALDLMRDKLEDAQIQHEMAALAVNVTTLQIQEIIRLLAKKKEGVTANG